MRPHGRAKVNIRSLDPFAICDGCGALYNHSELRWQLEWAGNKLINTKQLVCRRCNDIPNTQLRAIVLPADPMPVLNPRTQNYPWAETDYRTTSGQNTVDPITGIPIPGTTMRITENDEYRVLQATGAADGSRNTKPGTDPNAVTYRIVSAADGGKFGAVRLTLNTTSGMITGQKVIVQGVQGTAEANGSWFIEVISQTEIDLIGTDFMNEYEGGGELINDPSLPYGYPNIPTTGPEDNGPSPQPAPQAIIYADFISQLYLLNDTPVTYSELIDGTALPFSQYGMTYYWGLYPVVPPHLQSALLTEIPTTGFSVIVEYVAYSNSSPYYDNYPISVYYNDEAAQFSFLEAFTDSGDMLVQNYDDMVTFSRAVTIPQVGSGVRLGITWTPDAMLVSVNGAPAVQTDPPPAPAMQELLQMIIGSQGDVYSTSYLLLGGYMRRFEVYSALNADDLATATVLENQYFGYALYADFINSILVAGGSFANNSDVFDYTTMPFNSYGMLLDNNTADTNVYCLSNVIDAVNINGFTAVVEFVPVEAINGQIVFALSYINGNGVDNYVSIESNATSITVTDLYNSGSSLSRSITVPCDPQVGSGAFRVAVTWTSSRLSVSVNGGAVVSDTTSVSAMTAVADVNMGNLSGNSALTTNAYITFASIDTAQNDSILPNLATVTPVPQPPVSTNSYVYIDFVNENYRINDNSVSLGTAVDQIAGFQISSEGLRIPANSIPPLLQAAALSEIPLTEFTVVLSVLQYTDDLNIVYGLNGTTALPDYFRTSMVGIPYNFSVSGVRGTGLSTVPEVSAPVTPQVTGGVRRIAFTVSASQIAICVNGGTVYVDSTASDMPASWDDFAIGSARGSDFTTGNMYLRWLAIYPPMTNEEMQAITG